MERVVVQAAVGLAALVAAGCGGGGGGGMYGGGDSPMNLSSAPGESALNTYLESPHQSTLKASSGMNSYTLQYTTVPNAIGMTFNGMAGAESSVDTVTLQENGMLIGQTVSKSFYYLSPFMPLGTVYGNGTPFEVVTNFSPLPATLNVGNSGAFTELTAYHDSNKTVIDANVTTTYTVEPNNSTTLLLCLNSVTSNVTAQGTADGVVADTETDCYAIDAMGNAALFSIMLTVQGVTLNFM